MPVKNVAGRKRARAEQVMSDEVFKASVLITLTRQYDALILLLQHFDNENAEILVNAHEQGILYAPAPSIRTEIDE